MTLIDACRAIPLGAELKPALGALIPVIALALSIAVTLYAAPRSEKP